MTTPVTVIALELEDHTGATRALGDIVAEHSLTVLTTFRGFW